MQPPTKTEDSGSENDPDYVPQVDHDDSSSDGEREAKRPRTTSPKPTEEDITEKQKRREALWKEFQASASSPQPSSSRQTRPKTVKIEKRYRFAGEDVVEVKEVPEDSDEAKKWPRWQPSQTGDDTPHGTVAAEDTQVTATSASEATLSTEAASSTAQSTPIELPKPAKRPGPRKSKLKLEPVGGGPKAKKLTTLDKSTMDWRSHVETDQQSGLKDELEANRRGGGYLEKVEFLKRVEERKEEALEASKSTKRRR